MPALDAPRSDETLTDLLINDYQVLQKKQGFRFSLDAILLAHFAPHQKNWRVADLGTGTGVIPLLLTALEPTLMLDAVEIQPDMADMARRSVLLNGLSNIQVLEQDLRTMPTSYNDCYHLVLSNPPYFPVGAGKISPVPAVALSRHELACTLADLIKQSARLLKSGGHFALIHRPERLGEIFALCQAFHLAPCRLRLVHPSAQENANLILLDAIKGGHCALTVEKPLIIYQEPHHYSAEILHYYGGNTHD